MALTLDRLDAIFHSLTSGKSLKQTLKEQGVSAGCFFDAINTNPLQEVRYARAQQMRGELLVDEIIDIADTEPDPQAARNRIDARKWYASKMMPQKYGDRIDLNVNQTVDIGAALSEAQKRSALPRCYPDKELEGQVIETIALPIVDSTGSKTVDESSAESGNAGKLTPGDIFA